MHIPTLEIQVAAQGSFFNYVTSNLRAVYIDFIAPNVINTRVYYDFQPSELEADLADEADTEMISSIWNITDYKTSFDILTKPYPEPIRDPGFCVYARYEPHGIDFSSYPRPIPADNLTQANLGPIFCLMGVALLGRVTPDLRLVLVAFSEPNSLRLIFYYAKDPSQLEQELVKAAGDEFLSAYSEPLFHSKVDIVVIPGTERLYCAGDYRIVYQRYETLSYLDQ